MSKKKVTEPKKKPAAKTEAAKTEAKITEKPFISRLAEQVKAASKKPRGAPATAAPLEEQQPAAAPAFDWSTKPTNGNGALAGDHGGTPHDDLPADIDAKQRAEGFVPVEVEKPVPTPTPALASRRPFAYVAKVRSNLKATATEAASIIGGWEQRLSPYTLLLGDNATGKSRILQAVELAIRGKVSDHVGRAEVAEAGRLFQLAPLGATELWAEVEIFVPRAGGPVGPGDFDDPRAEALILKARWSSKKGAKPKHELPGVIDPARAFPLVGVREAILGSVDTARRFFFRHAASRLGLAEVWWKIPVEIYDAVKAVGLPDKTTQGVAPEEVVTSLLSAVEKARKRELESAAELRTAAKLIDERAGMMPPEPTDAQIDDAQAAVRAAQDALAKSQAAAGMGGGAVIAEKAAVARRKLSEISARGHALTEQRARMKPPVGDAPLAAIESVLDTAVKEHLQHCTACGTDGIGHRFPERLEMVRRARGANAQAATEVNRLDGELRMLESEYLMQKAILESLEAAGAAAATGSPDPGALPLAEARANLDAATKHHTELVSLRAQWKTVHDDRGRRTVLEKTEKDAKLCTKTLKEIVGELLESSIDDFRKIVQSFLPSKMEFGIELRDEEGVAGSFSFGLRLVGSAANGKKGSSTLFTGLSGAEWAMVTAALAAAVASKPSPAGSNPLAILIPEDRAFDPIHLAEALTALGRWNGQVLIGSPTPPARVVPGWTTIATGSAWARGTLADGSSYVSDSADGGKKVRTGVRPS